MKNPQLSKHNRLKTKTLNKTISRSIKGSLGRFLSIFSLMALGTFAFVGLKVSGPDMRATAEHFYAQHHLADLTVTSTYGLDASDEALLQSAKGVKKVEFGFFQDVLIKGKTTSVRIFSTPKQLSTYQVIQGKLPRKNNEIALDYLFSGDYHVGQKITFSKNNKSDVLKKHTFKIVGFVKSSEYVDKSSLGQTTIGTGQLNAYALVSPSLFASKDKMIARITFTKMQNVSPYASKFTSLSSYYQNELESLVKNQPQKRLTRLKKPLQNKITQSKNDLISEQEKINSQQTQLDQESSQLASTPAGKAQLAQMQQQLTQGTSEISSHMTQLTAQQAQIDALALPIYTVNDRKAGNPGYQNFIDNSTRIDALSNIFPVVLFAIAALVSLTTMTRFVEEERSNLGLLKALGYSHRQIRKKFIIYGLISASTGSAVGIILGHIVLPNVVFKAYTASSTFSGLILTFSWFWTLAALVVALLCTLLPAYFVSQAELTEVPARLFLAKAPKAGSRILLEYITPLWKRMNFTSKVTLRNLFRYKSRALMTIVGIAGCTALLVMGFGIRDSISGLGSRQFGKILHYDLIAVHDEKLPSSSEKELNKVLHSNQVVTFSSIHFEQVTKVAGREGNTQQIAVIVPQASSHFSNFVSLQTRLTQKKLSLSNQGAIISEKLAKLLHAKVGDRITLNAANNQTITVKISGITEMYMGHYLFMNAHVYQQTFNKKMILNAELVKLKNNSPNQINQMSANLMKISGMDGISQNEALKGTIDAFLAGINSVMLVLIGCAILLAIVVIYNLTNINVSERIRELSTIKVLGFYDREVTLYIYRETILLSLIGILCGFGLGAYFHQVIMTMLPPDTVMFSPGLSISNLILSTLITLATTLALSIVVHYKLKNVDMLGALKSVD